ncbi:hypothetical protein [Vibrio anguillarum]|nr:hypothetical protein [Vibrio anguillarum]
MLHLHPNKSNPERWRVQDKSLNEQVYFPFAKYGSKEAAFSAATH